MKSAVWWMIVALVALHQWDPFREDGTLVCGAIPRALAYHVGVSLAAAAVWILTARFAWPDVTGPAEKEADA